MKSSDVTIGTVQINCSLEPIEVSIDGEEIGQSQCEDGQFSTHINDVSTEGKKEDDEELKWVDEQKDIFDQKEVEGNIQKDETDEFRITMAQNIFNREESDPLPQKLKKKKKKKISPLRRKDEE